MRKDPGRKFVNLNNAVSTEVQKLNRKGLRSNAKYLCTNPPPGIIDPPGDEAANLFVSLCPCLRDFVVQKF